MSKAPSMPVFVDALIGDTLGLSPESFGAFCLILFATWRNDGKPFADDDCRLARICRVTVKRWRERLRPELIGFFDLSAGTWRQHRLEKEWNFVAKQVEQKRCAGNASHKAKALKNQETWSTAVDEPLPSRCQQPTPTPIEGSKEDKGELRSPLRIPSESDLTESVAARDAPEPDRSPCPAQANSVARIERQEDQDLGNPEVRLTPPPQALPAARLRENIKTQLRQKLMRYCKHRLHGDAQGRAIAGLMGCDTDHDAQWWLDAVDRQRKREHWDDTREWKREHLGVA